MRKQQEKDDPDAPGSVHTDPLAKEIFGRTRTLARDGREDADAVAELRAIAAATAVASPRRAAQPARRPTPREPAANDIHRLLKAAVANQPVEPITPREVERFEALAFLFDRSRPDHATFAELARREPQLLALEADVRAGRFGTLDERPTSEQLSDPVWQREQGERARLSLEMMARLKQLAGPHCSHPDPVMKARVARDHAMFYLQKLRPPAQRPDPPPGSSLEHP